MSISQFRFPLSITAKLAIGWLVAVGAVGVVSPWLPLPFGPGAPDLLHVAEPPSWATQHWLGTDLLGRDVLIIDDILDEGHTLGAIIDFCHHAGAANVHTAVLIDKDHDRKARPDLKADYVGLPCIDRYIFGYGMDYKGYWRNAPGIYAVKGL